MIDKITIFQGINRWLSNFYEAQIEYNGIAFPTTEHAYQAMKSADQKVQRAIAMLPKPGQAMVVGRALVLRPDWDDIKLQVMLDVNRLKYNCHDHLKQKLLATENAELIEGNTWGDTFYGVCNGIGENNLGKILMKIRDELREENKN